MRKQKNNFKKLWKALFALEAMFLPIGFLHSLWNSIFNLNPWSPVVTAFLPIIVYAAVIAIALFFWAFYFLIKWLTKVLK